MELRRKPPGAARVEPAAPDQISVDVEILGEDPLTLDAMRVFARVLARIGRGLDASGRPWLSVRRDKRTERRST